MYRKRHKRGKRLASVFLTVAMITAAVPAQAAEFSTPDSFEQIFSSGEENSYIVVSVCLVLISVVLTGFQLYEPLAKWCGAGTLVPITGFANSVASPAIEYQREGQVFGIGVKIFTIAGPVILYGVFTSWVIGCVYWIFFF